MRQLRPEAPRQKGFTLIELLIVIVILGVLAAVVVLALGAYDQRGERAACETDVKAVEVAVEAYLANEGHYPQTLDELTEQPATYLRQLPNTSPSGGAYWITYDEATGQVGGQLEDGSICAGDLLAAPGPSGTETTEPPGGGGPTDTGSTTPGGTGSTPPGGTGSTPPGGTGSTPPDDTSSTQPGGGTSSTPPDDTGSTPSGGTTTTTTTAGGGATSSTSTSPNPSPTPGTLVAGVNCLNPPGFDPWDCVASWSVPDGLVTGYEWQLVPRFGPTCSANDFPWLWPAIDTTATSYTFDVLFRGTYCFRVRAENGTINGPWSQVVPFSWP